MSCLQAFSSFSSVRYGFEFLLLQSYIVMQLSDPALRRKGPEQELCPEAVEGDISFDLQAFELVALLVTPDRPRGIADSKWPQAAPADHQQFTAKS